MTNKDIYDRQLQGICMIPTYLHTIRHTYIPTYIHACMHAYVHMYAYTMQLMGGLPPAADVRLPNPAHPAQKMHAGGMLTWAVSRMIQGSKELLGVLSPRVLCRKV